MTSVFYPLTYALYNKSFNLVNNQKKSFIYKTILLKKYLLNNLRKKAFFNFLNIYYI